MPGAAGVMAYQQMMGNPAALAYQHAMMQQQQMQMMIQQQQQQLKRAAPQVTRI
jgi:hypothetical protein